MAITSVGADFVIFVRKYEHHCLSYWPPYWEKRKACRNATLLGDL